MPETEPLVWWGVMLVAAMGMYSGFVVGTVVMKSWNLSFWQAQIGAFLIMAGFIIFMRLTH